MADFCTCSKCGADLRGPVIPPEHPDHYGGNPVCQHGCGGPRHFSRIIGVINIDADRIESWLCPDCGHQEVRRG